MLTAMIGLCDVLNEVLNSSLNAIAAGGQT
jgi:hypothetical protein